MGSVENQYKSTALNRHEAYLSAAELTAASSMPVIMETCIELQVFEIIAKAGEGAHLTPWEIASHFPTKRHEAPIMLDRMLRYLTCHSVLSSSTLAHEDGRVERLYGLTAVSKYLVKNEDEASLAPLLLWNNWMMTNCRYYLKDVVLDGGVTFERVNGMPFYDYMRKNPKVSELFNRAMFQITYIVMKKVLDDYNGFDNLKEVIDAGGGNGAFSEVILTKYPKIKCINFDLPHVVKDLPTYPGVTHVGGDMISSIPRGENIFIKTVLFHMTDEQCLKILRNCYEALPNHGKLILMEFLFATVAGTDKESKYAATLDVQMMMNYPQGKQRAFEEYKNIAAEAGFVHFEKVCYVCSYGIMEFRKTLD